MLTKKFEFTHDNIRFIVKPSGKGILYAGEWATVIDATFVTETAVFGCSIVLDEDVNRAQVKERLIESAAACVHSKR